MILLEEKKNKINEKIKKQYIQQFEIAIMYIIILIVYKRKLYHQ